MGHPGEDAGEVLAALIADLGMPRSLATVKIGPENKFNSRRLRRPVRQLHARYGGGSDCREGAIGR